MQLSLESMEAYLALFGMNDRNMAVLEQELEVSAALRQNELIFKGAGENIALAERVVGKLIDMLRKGEMIDPSRIRYAAALAREGRLDEMEEIMGDVVAITYPVQNIGAESLCRFRARK